MTPKTTAGKGRVVLLSADPADAAFVRAVVEAAGYQVAAVCSNPTDALQTVRDTRPDLVLSAIFFDGEPAGIEISRLIQDDVGTPIVYLGEAEDPLLVLQISMTQPVGLVADPRDAKYLEAVVSRALKGARPTPVVGPY